MGKVGHDRLKNLGMLTENHRSICFKYKTSFLDLGKLFNCNGSFSANFYVTMFPSLLIFLSTESQNSRKKWPVCMHGD